MAKNKAVISFLLCFIMLFNVTSTVVEAFGSLGFRDSEISFGGGEYNIQIDDSDSRYTVVSFTPISDEEDAEIKREIANRQNSIEKEIETNENSIEKEIETNENFVEEEIDVRRFYRSRQRRDLSTQGIDFTTQAIDYTTYVTTVRVDVETDPTAAEGFPWDKAFPSGIDLTIRSFDYFEVFDTQTTKVTKEGMAEFPEKMRVYNEIGKKLVFSISVPKDIDINPIIEQIYGTGNYSDGTKVLTMSATSVQILSTKFTTKWHSTKDASTFPSLRGTFNVGQGAYAFNLPKDGEFTIIRNDNGDQRLVSPDILSPKIPEHAVILGIEGAGIKEGKVGDYFFETVYSKLDGGIFKFYEVMTITLDPNGGTVEPDKVKVGYTKPGGELPTPTPPTGKTFSKWVYEDGSDYDPTAAVNSNITVKSDYGDKPFDPDNVVRMKITTPPDKVDYKVGEKFDPTGMKVTLTDINGITKVVPYVDFAANNLSVPTDKELTLSDTKVTVTYEKGITKLTDDQPITVRKASVEKVTVRFLSGSHGTLIGNTVITVDVGTPFSEVRAKMPTVSPFRGYTHTGWSPSLPSGTTLVTRSATYTATYKLTDNVIPVDPTDPIPEDYVRVRFLPGTDGRLIGNTHFNVRIGTPFREVRAKMPTVSPYSGYYHYGWDPSLPLDSNPVYRGATYTAIYRRTTSSIDDGFIIWSVAPSQPSVTPTVPTLPQAKPTLIKDDHFAYIKGYPNGTFRGEASITRGEVAAIFARLVKGGITGIESGATYYSDVKVTDWYHDSIAFLSKHKIIEGYPDGTFRPEKPITRAEFSAIASRFSNVNGGNSNFSDVPSSHWAKRYIDFAYTEGWITGYPDGTFRPDRNITRAEAVTMVNKVLNRSADKKYVDNNLALLVRFTDLNNDYWAYYNIIEAANSHDYTRNADGSETWIRVR